MFRVLCTTSLLFVLPADGGRSVRAVSMSVSSDGSATTERDVVRKRMLWDVQKKPAKDIVRREVNAVGHVAYDANRSESLPKLVVGFHTSWIEKYTKRLESQLNTWAADIPANRILVSGGRHDNVGATTACPNDRDQTCKDAAILYAAAQRTAETGAYWFLGVHEDAYVRMDELAKALPKIERPVMLAGVGCGQSWQYHKDNNGTNAPPPGWVEPGFACQSVWEHGGLCTGPAYLINRPALLKLSKGYDRFEDFFQKYMSHFHGPEHHRVDSSDRLMGCVFRDMEIGMEQIPDDLYWQDAVDIGQDWQKRPATPNMIHNGHAVILNIIGPFENVESNRARIPTFMHEVHKYLVRSKA